MNVSPQNLQEKERDLSRFSGSAVWLSILSCVAQLASVEKLYMNLSFLTAKGFLRKEVCTCKIDTSSYEVLKSSTLHIHLYKFML